MGNSVGAGGAGWRTLGARQKALQNATLLNGKQVFFGNIQFDGPRVFPSMPNVPKSQAKTPGDCADFLRQLGTLAEPYPQQKISAGFWGNLSIM
jgi:hypothetical protein